MLSRPTQPRAAVTAPPARDPCAGHPGPFAAAEASTRRSPGTTGTPQADPSADADDIVERPVFVLAPTWRCGSTLMQRLLTASGEAWLWGEPFDRAAPLLSLHEQLAPFGDDWPTVDHEVDPEDPGSTWIALMSPSRAQLLAAHRAFVRELLRPPHPSLRWGCKEVRLGAPQVDWLLELFPQARIVLLVRDPVAAWSSFAANPGWWWRWPRERVHDPTHFADLWARQAGGFHSLGTRPECLLVRHEDVVAGTVLDDLAGHVGLTVTAAPLDHVVRGIAEPAIDPSPDVVALVRSRTADVAARFGYGDA